MTYIFKLIVLKAATFFFFLQWYCIFRKLQVYYQVKVQLLLKRACRDSLCNLATDL